MPTVREVVHNARADDYRWRSIIGGIVKSEPFLMRTAPPKSATIPTIAESGVKTATARQ